MSCCRKRKLKERSFRPNYAFKALTEKFYARHDNVEILVDNLKNYTYFANQIEKRLRFDRRDYYHAPITENQTYGWLERLAEKYTGLDAEILVHKPPYDEMMHVIKQIAFDVNREHQLNKL